MLWLMSTCRKLTLVYRSCLPRCYASSIAHAQFPICACREFIVSGKETSASISKGGHTQGTAQEDSELEQKEAGVQQEDTVLAQGATPGGSALNPLSLISAFLEGYPSIVLIGGCRARADVFQRHRCPSQRHLVRRHYVPSRLYMHTRPVCPSFIIFLCTPWSGL